MTIVHEIFKELDRVILDEEIACLFFFLGLLNSFPCYMYYIIIIIMGIYFGYYWFAAYA